MTGCAVPPYRGAPVLVELENPNVSVLNSLAAPQVRLEDWSTSRTMD